MSAPKRSKAGRDSSDSSLPKLKKVRTAEAPRPRHAVAMSNKDDLLRRLRRVEGQVRGVAQMVEDERYCPDILAQISAIDAALQGVAQGLVANHLRHCATHALYSGDPAVREAMVDELITILKRRA